MTILNTKNRWGSIAQTFHWLILLLIILQFITINWAYSLPLGGEKIALFARHKSIGMTILILAILRLLWRWINPTPDLPSTLKPYERFLARITHVALYGLLFALPLSGWLMSSARNFPVSWFGWLQLPDLVRPNEQLADFLSDAHGMMVNCLIAIAILHVLGALKHHFVYKDQVLRRMLPFTRIPVVLILGVLLSTPGLAATYVLDPARSTLTFAFSQAGALSEGRFGKFAVTLEVADDTKTPQKLAVVVNIDSVSTDDAERDALLRGVDLFNVIKFPQALFRSSAIRATGNGQYVATGTLSIRGISRPLQVPFTFSNGEMQGQVVINRLDFGVGQGEWQATDSVGNAVTVKFSLRLM